MLEKPNLPDDLIIAALREHYHLPVTALEFLPIGNDATAWVYRISTENALAYFLKLKHSTIIATNLTVPRYLYESGITQVVSPIPNQSHALWTPLNDFNLIVYPFILGETGMKTGLPLDQWQEFGVILKRVHSTEIPPELAQQIPREAFNINPNWMNAIQAIEHILPRAIFRDDLEGKLALFWRERHEEIRRIINRAQEIGSLLQTQSLPFVLCHADIHTANMLIDGAGQLFIVDWDQTLFAPKERDLMFVLGERDPSLSLTDAEQMFTRGYGEIDMNWLAIAYYRYEWVVQEIADFGERVFLTQDIGDETKKDAVLGFKQLFLPDDVIALALACDTYLATHL